MTVLHMTKSEIDDSDSDFLFNVISSSIGMFSHFIGGLGGNSHPGVGTGFSPSSVK